MRNTTAAPVVTIGGVSATVTFAGLSPQYVGVYQINVTLPSTQLPANAAPLQIQTGGVTGTVQTTVAVGTGWAQWALTRNTPATPL